MYNTSKESITFHWHCITLIITVHATVSSHQHSIHVIAATPKQPPFTNVMYSLQGVA